MKKYILSLFVAIIAVTFVSCEKKDPRDEIVGYYTTVQKTTIVVTTSGKSEIQNNSGTATLRIEKDNRSSNAIRIVDPKTLDTFEGDFFNGRVSLDQFYKESTYTENGILYKETMSITMTSALYNNGRMVFDGYVEGYLVSKYSSTTIKGTIQWTMSR